MVESRHTFRVNTEMLPLPRLPTGTAKPGFGKVFWNVLQVVYKQDTHIVFSICTETIRSFPRFVRISMFYCSIFMYLVFGHVCVFLGYGEDSYSVVIHMFFATLIIELIITLLSLLTRVSTRSLTNAKNTEDLIKKS